jgi:hypothetical protein
MTYHQHQTAWDKLEAISPQAILLLFAAAASHHVCDNEWCEYDTVIRTKMHIGLDSLVSCIRRRVCRDHDLE